MTMEQMIESPKKIFNKIGFTCAVYVLIWRIFVEISSVLINHFVLDLRYANPIIQWIISYSSLYFIAFPVLLLLMKQIPENTLTPPKKQKMKPSLFILLLFPSLSISFIVSIFFNLLSMILIKRIHNPLADRIMNLDLAPAFILILVIAPIMEELVFRKILYHKLSAYGSKTYIITSALFFSLGHLNIVQSVYAFAAGFFLAWIMYQTGKVIYPILFHMILNFFGTGLPLLIQKYVDDDLTVFVTGLSNIILLLLGAGFGIYLLYCFAQRKLVFFEKGDKEKPKMSVVFGNPGYILFISITGLYIIFMFIRNFILGV